MGIQDELQGLEITDEDLRDELYKLSEDELAKLNKAADYSDFYAVGQMYTRWIHNQAIATKSGLDAYEVDQELTKCEEIHTKRHKANQIGDFLESLTEEQAHDLGACLMNDPLEAQTVVKRIISGAWVHKNQAVEGMGRAINIFPSIRPEAA